MLFGLTSCAEKKGAEQTTTFQSVSASAENNTETAVNKTTEQATDGQENISSDVGGGELTLQKYRSIYYSIPSPFWDIVDENSREDLYGKYWEIPYSETNIMRMKIFVEEYKVPREEFDAANAEWARIIKEKLYGTPVINPQDYANQEFNEVYNADIIYTFNDEIINEYYLSHDYPYCYESEYEYAVENDLYTTQTTEIIDLSDLSEKIALFNQLKTYYSSNRIESELDATVFYETLTFNETPADPTEPIEVTAEQTEPI